MFPLLETIRFEKGKFNNIEYHINRMKQSVSDCSNQSLQFVPEQVFLEAQQSFGEKPGLFKFRLLYNNKSYQWEFVPYTLPDIHTLKLTIDDQIDYSCKFSDRKKLNQLKEQRDNADDILIIKNGAITDTSFANIIFSDGTNWFTPKNPLLRGTQRAYLIDQGIISEAVIAPDDIKQFKEVRLINAMIRFDDKIIITNIY
jgi:4-amino-4-deoxychorismate lyase